MIKNISINVRNIVWGNEEIEFVFGDTTILFDASYIGPEPSKCLIITAYELPNLGYEKFTLADELGYMTMAFTNKDGILTIEIEKEDWQEDVPTLYHFETLYKVYKDAVIKAAVEALKTYGIVGFMFSWSNRDDVFPIGELLSLLDIIPVHHEESNSLRSNLKEELQLLINVSLDGLSDNDIW